MLHNSLAEAGGCIGTRRVPSQSLRPCIALNLLRCTCLTKLLYAQQNTHSREGSVSLNGMILSPKPSMHSNHANPQQMTWFMVRACKGSCHTECLGTGNRAILNLRVKVYCPTSNLAFGGLWKNKRCSFPLVNGLL